MSEENQDKNQIQSNNNGQSRAHLTLLVLILGILSIASIGILTLTLLRQMYPKVFAAPGIAKQLNYQGKLQDAGGITVPDGSYGMQFTIYDAASGGNILWTARESDACGAPYNPAAKSVSTYKGIFSTLLGETGDCPINLDFADDAYYLGVTIGADPEMTPRKRIGAAGYAFNADLLDGLNTSNAGGANAFVPVTDASGNFVLSKDITFDTNTFLLDSTNDAVGMGGAPTPFTQVYVTTAKTTGLYADSSAVGGRGISGAASATTGLTVGGSFTAGPPPFLLLPGADIGVFGAGFSPAQIAYGGYFMGGDYGVYGTESNVGGYGLYGSAVGASGTGVFGQATSPTGTTYGVYGQATGTLAVNYGGYFKSAGPGGQGVYGEATDSSAAINYGGYFTSAGTGFTPPFTVPAGVYGEATSTTTINTGGYFTTAGQVNNASGVIGIAPYAGAVQNFGGLFFAYGDTARGVLGKAMSTNAFANYGVRGEADGTGAGTAGLFGQVGGAANDLYGVYGEANNSGAYTNFGGYFKAQGESGRGVHGEALYNAVAVPNYGGYFVSGGQIGQGVYGEASSSTATTNYGGYFKASGQTARAVYGEADAISPTANYGGYFAAAGTGGAAAVYADSSGATGVNYGVYGKVASSSGLSGYFTGGQGAQVVGNVINTADATFNPLLKSTTATGAGVINLFVSGRYAYILNSTAATLQIFDVTEPTAPISMSSTAIAANPRYVYVSGRYAYIVHDTVTSTLEIFDISNPTAPVLVSSTATGLDPKAIYVSGHYAYIADTGPDTFEIFDVSNPVSPISVGSVPTSVDPFHVFVSGQYAYVVSQAPASNLEIFNISNPAAPIFVGAVFAPGDPRGVYVSGRYAYVANLGGALQVFDISNPVVPVMAGSVAAGNPYSVYVSGRYAYVADAFGSTIKTVDVSKPSAPVVVGSAATSSTPTSVYVSGRYAYLANAGANNFEIFDVSGLETTSGMVHSLEVGNLQVRNDIITQGELNVEGGLNVGGTGLFNDSLSVHSNGNSGGYFQADGASATGLVGYTTQSSSTALVGYALGADSTGVSAVADPFAAGLSFSRGGNFSAGTGSAVIGGGSHMMGVQGMADGGTGTNYGGVFTAGNLVSTTIAGANNIGVAGFAEDSAGTNYGVYGSVSASGWAGYFTGGDGLYTGRFSVADITSGVAYNTIGVAATSHGFASTNDLFIAGQLEVDGASWFDGGHTDLAEMINYSGQGEAGDVIVIDEKSDNTAKLADKPYDKNVLGIISTNPSLVITGNIKDGKLLAVAGRVPTKVTNLNGPVARGDLLTTSPKPGYAMKATEPGPVVGKALEPCNQDSCTIWVFLNVGWNGGANTSIAAANSFPSVVYQNVALDKLTADLDAKGFAIKNVSKISSADGKWSIDENGLLVNQIEFTRDNETVKKDIYVLSSTGAEVVLSGSAKLDSGEFLVDFSQVDKDFIEIIDQTVPLKISVTPTENCAGLYVAEKYPQGFKVKEMNSGVSNAAFDWMVISKRKGY